MKNQYWVQFRVSSCFSSIIYFMGKNIYMKFWCTYSMYRWKFNRTFHTFVITYNKPPHSLDREEKTKLFPRCLQSINRNRFSIFVREILKPNNCLNAKSTDSLWSTIPKRKAEILMQLIYGEPNITHRDHSCKKIFRKQM